MPDEPRRILIKAGRWIGPNSLANDAEFRAKIDEGFEVFTEIRNVFFQITPNGESGVTYSSLPKRPAGI